MEDVRVDVGSAVVLEAFPRCVDVGRLRSCSVECNISLLIEGESRLRGERGERPEVKIAAVGNDSTLRRT